MDEEIIELLIVLEEGKYEVKLYPDGRFVCDRYGEPWRNLVGDKLILALCHMIRNLNETMTRSLEEERCRKNTTQTS